MDIFNKKKIQSLELDLSIQMDRVRQLEAEVKRLSEFELKFKIAQMLVDDDPAIDELLSCKKEIDNVSYPSMNSQAVGLPPFIKLANGQAQGNAGFFQGIGLGLTW